MGGSFLAIRQPSGKGASQSVLASLTTIHGDTKPTVRQLSLSTIGTGKGSLKDGSGILSLGEVDLMEIQQRSM